MSSSLAKADLPSQIADELRSAIFSGEFAPGSRLPPEVALADQFGVSRPTVREALSRLAAQGFVNSRRGSHGGAFVATADDPGLEDRLADLLALGALRHQLDLATMRRAYAEALTSALEQFGPDASAALDAALARLSAAAPETLAEAHHDFHRALFTASAAPMAVLIAAGLAGALGTALSPSVPTQVDCGRIAALCARLAGAAKRKDSEEMARNISDWLNFLQTGASTNGAAISLEGSRDAK